MLATQFKCQAFKMYLVPGVIHLHSHNTELCCIGGQGTPRLGNEDTEPHSVIQIYPNALAIVHTRQCPCTDYYPVFLEASITREQLMKCTSTNEQSQLCSVAKVGLNHKCPLETVKKRNPHEFWKKTWIHSEWLAFSAWGQQGLQITPPSHYLKYHNSCIVATVD